MSTDSGATARTATPRWISRLSPADAAWLGPVPAGLLLLATFIWLAPPLSDLIYPEQTTDFFAFPGRFVRPEHAEGTRYLLAVLGAFLVAAWVIWTATHAGDSRHDRVVIAVQVGFLAFLAVCALEQRSAFNYLGPTGRDTAIFSLWNWAGALAIGAAVIVAVLGAWRPRLGRLGRELGRIANRRIIVVAAITLTVLGLLPGVFTDEMVGRSQHTVLVHLPVYFDEYVAVLNGRTPLVDFIPEFTFLLPYAAAPVLSVFGHSITTFTVLMTAFSAIGLLAAYGTLAAATGRRDVGLALYLPVLAIAVIPYAETGVERTYLANLYALTPDRYLAPLLVVWLCATHLRSARPAGWVIFLAAGLAALNNAEFGLSCLVAAFVALWLGAVPTVSPRPRTRALIRQAAIGLGAALAIVSLITLARADSLPDLSLLFYFAAVHGQQGYALLPMPELGFHIVLYLTFVAALLMATVRSASGAPNRVLTGALAYAGAFGLLAGVYYVGTSESTRLMALFPVWGVGVALLAYTTLRSLDAARLDRLERRRALLPALATCVALGLMVTALSEYPRPWSQIDRFSSDAPYPYDSSAAEAFIRRRTSPGETVVILTTLGHGVAEDAGVENASPFNDPRVTILSAQQMDRVVDSLANGGGSRVFMDVGVYPEIPEYLAKHGFVATADDRASDITEWQSAKTEPQPAS
jgi:hypothetical protein